MAVNGARTSERQLVGTAVQHRGHRTDVTESVFGDHETSSPSTVEVRDKITILSAAKEMLAFPDLAEALEILQPGDVLILHRALAAPTVRSDDDQLRDAPLATAGASGVIPRSSSTTTVLPKRPRRIYSNLEVDPDGRRVFVGGELVDLTRIEFDILDLLSANPGVVVSRDQLFAEVWGDNHCDDHGLEVHISNLRKKLDKAGQAPRRIQTVRGVGYRLERS